MSYKYYWCPNSALKVKKGSKTLLALWKAKYAAYDIENNSSMPYPLLQLKSITQTSATVQVINYYDEYVFYLNNDKIQGESVTMSGLFPETSVYFDLYVATGNKNEGDTFSVYLSSISPNTNKISPSIQSSSTASTSIRATGTYRKEDAQVVAETMKVYGSGLNKQVDGNPFVLTGLNPNTTYTIEYEITVSSGGQKKAYSSTATVKTEGLTLVTSQPKVISVGNVIVAAQSNMDEEETNAGFEWRRTDWPDDFASSTGAAYVYNGTMEGYIRNLNTDKLWRCRPYYLSDSGTYYYGDWMGIDPTNISYFEPTVHTYEQVEIDGNTALVKGYAMTGTDGVTVQGFMYWKSVAGAQSADATNRAVAIPGDATTVEASGQVMTANLTGLDYNSTYHYVAFVKTTTGETFYGEERMFDTEADPTGISEVVMDKPTTSDMVRKGIYTLSGMKVADDISELYSLPYGVYIVNGKKYNLSRNSRP